MRVIDGTIATFSLLFWLTGAVCVCLLLECRDWIDRTSRRWQGRN